MPKYDVDNKESKLITKLQDPNIDEDKFDEIGKKLVENFNWGKRRVKRIKKKRSFSDDDEDLKDIFS